MEIEPEPTCAILFKPQPKQWGLRGDLYLWKDLSRVFRRVPLPDSAELLTRMLEGAFMALTAKSISHTDEFLVKRYMNGGMSSGFVSPEFWSRDGFPLLRERFLKQKDGSANRQGIVLLNER